MKRQLLALTTCILLVGCQSGSEQGGGAWSYSENLDKLTGNQTYTAKAQLSDKETPLVLTDIVLKCDPKQPGNSISPKGKISIELTTLKSIPKGSVRDEMRELDGMPMVGVLDNNILVVSLAVRADTESPLTAFGLAEQFNNRVSLTLKDGGEKIDSVAALLSLSGSVFISPSTQKEIVVRIPTEQGNPTLSIPLQNSSVKKVASQCGWNLGQQVVAATSATSNSQRPSASVPEAQAATASPADKQIVGRWYKDQTFPFSGKNHSGDGRMVRVDEHFANGGETSEGQLTIIANFDLGAAEFNKMEISFDVKEAYEWKIKDGSLSEKRVSANIVPGYIKIDGAVLEDEAKKTEMFKGFERGLEKLFPIGKITEVKIISLDTNAFVYEHKDDDGKVTRVSATRTDKNFSAYRES